MRYILNPFEYSEMFAIPKSVCEKHLKLASVAQLKVLLLLLSSGEINKDLKEISLLLNINVVDVQDSFDFWVERGVIVDSGFTPNIVIENKDDTKIEVKNSSQQLNKQITDILISAKPNRDEVNHRMEYDNAIAFLFKEVEANVARLLSEHDKSTLLWLHDFKQLPIEVILMVVQYCVSINKSNLRYIETVAVSWSEEDINSVIMAEAKVNMLKNTNQAWGVISRCMGLDNNLPTKKQLEYAQRWVCEYNFTQEMLKIAYEICIDSINKVNLTYINGILVKWYNNKIFTKTDLKDYVAEAKTVKPKGQPFKTNVDIKKLEELID